MKFNFRKTAFDSYSADEDTDDDINHDANKAEFDFKKAVDPKKIGEDQEDQAGMTTRRRSTTSIRADDKRRQPRGTGL